MGLVARSRFLYARPPDGFGVAVCCWTTSRPMWLLHVHLARGTELVLPHDGRGASPTVACCLQMLRVMCPWTLCLSPCCEAMMAPCSGA